MAPAPQVPSPWEKVSADLINTRRSNATGYFIPREAMRDILDKDTVIELLSHHTVDLRRHSRQHVIRLIMGKGLELFAAVVLGNTPRKVGPLLAKNCFNARVPPNSYIFCDRMKGSEMTEAEAKSLYNQLRDVQAWKLRYRQREDLTEQEMTMPFLVEEQLQRSEHGGFGKMSYVTISQEHLDERIVGHEAVRGTFEDGELEPGLWIPRITLVQKSVPYGDDAESEHGILNQIEHPSLVPLLFAYTHAGNFNMLFPKYDETLAKFMTQQNVPWSLQECLDAFIGLAGGLLHLHRESDQPYEPYSKIGSHNDLKPENIMVDHTNQRFIIIDLGFAVVREPSDGSRFEETAFGSPYLAPEALNHENTSGRARDVWALGCIFLELLVSLGPVFGMQRMTLQEFRQKRMRKAGRLGVSVCHFHDEEGSRLHHGVKDLINQIEASKVDVAHRLVAILRGMLDVSYKSRFSMQQVTEQFENFVTSYSANETHNQTFGIDTSGTKGSMSKIKVTTENSVSIPQRSSFMGDGHSNGVSQDMQRRLRSPSFQAESPTPKTEDKYNNYYDLRPFFPQEECQQLLLLWEDAKIHHWASTCTSEVLLAYNDGYNIATSQNVLSCLLAHAIASANNSGIITGYHFCDQDSNPQGIARDISAQLQDTLSAASGQPTQHLAEILSLDDLIDMLSSIPASKRVCIFIDRIDECDEDSDSLSQVSQIITPFLEAIQRSRNHPEQHATLKLFVTVCGPDDIRDAQCWGNIVEEDILCNFRSERGVHRNSLTQCDSGDHWQLSWCNN